MKIQRKSFIIFLVLFPFIFPETFALLFRDGYIINTAWLSNSIFCRIITGIYRLRNILAIYSIVLLFLNYTNRLERSKLNFFVFILYLYIMWIVFLSLKNGVNLYSTIRDMIVCFGFVCWIVFFLKSNGLQMLCEFKNMLLVFLLLNLIFAFRYPTGIVTGTDVFKTKYFLLGTKNQATPILLLSTFLSFYFDKYKTKRAWFEGSVIILNTFIMHSATGIIGVCLMYFMNILANYKCIKKHILNAKIKWVIIVMIGAISILLVLGKVGQYFGWFLVDVLGKDATLNSRTIIWEHAIAQIKQNCFWGYGYGHFIFQHYYAHNMILELLSISGIVGLSIYGVLITIVVHQVIKNKASNPLIFRTLIVLFIVNTVEAYLFNVFQLTMLISMLYLCFEKPLVNRKNKNVIEG